MLRFNANFSFNDLLWAAFFLNKSFIQDKVTPRYENFDRFRKASSIKIPLTFFPLAYILCSSNGLYFGRYIDRHPKHFKWNKFIISHVAYISPVLSQVPMKSYSKGVASRAICQIGVVIECMIVLM